MAPEDDSVDKGKSEDTQLNSKANDEQNELNTNQIRQSEPNLYEDRSYESNRQGSVLTRNDPAASSNTQDDNLEPSISRNDQPKRVRSLQPLNPPSTAKSTFPPQSPSNSHVLSNNSHVNSQTTTQSIFDTNLHYYPHRPNIIPPYVLDALSQVHYKEQLNNSNTNVPSHDPKEDAKGHMAKHLSHISHSSDDEYLSFQNDLFVKSMHNNWHTFLQSVKQPSSLADPYLDQVFDDKKLEGRWGGDDRLKAALLGDSSDDDVYSSEIGSFPLFGWLSRSQKKRKAYGTKKKDKSNNGDDTVVRSKAGYWMSTNKRAIVIPALKRIFLQNPLIPLFLRILIIVFSTVALALAISIFVFSRRQYDGSTIEQQPSTIMAVAVQCCAIFYLVYIGYDEYAGKPLGLRDPWGKMRLIMLDMLFIIFSSANLSLAFNTLFDDEWVCETNPNSPDLLRLGVVYPTVSSICHRQRALASILFVVLCLWVVTFSISLVRVVHRVSSKSPNA